MNAKLLALAGAVIVVGIGVAALVFGDRDALDPAPITSAARAEADETVRRKPTELALVPESERPELATEAELDLDDPDATERETDERERTATIESMREEVTAANPAIFPNFEAGEHLIKLISGHEILELNSIEINTIEINGAIQLFLESRMVEQIPDGPYTSEFEDGTIKEQGRYENRRKVGGWTTWHASGERADQGRYVYDQKHGFWTEWHANGEKKAEGEYLYGRKEGPWTEYHDNGIHSRTAIHVNGVIDGRVVTWFADGQKESDSFYTYGDLNQAWRSWHANGELASRGQHDFGERVGRWEFRDEEGEPDEDQSGFYENGEKVRD